MKKSSLLIFIAILAFLFASLSMLIIDAKRTENEPPVEEPIDGGVSVPVETPSEPSPASPEAPDDPGYAVEPEGPEITEQPEEPAPPWPPPFEPYAVEGTKPDRMIASEAIMAEGRRVDSFSFPEPIDFGAGVDYSQIEGITTFRGNNFRNNAAFGFSDIKNAKFGERWTRNTGNLTAPDGTFWSGHGWTGQALIVKWPKETREIMNMHSWAKEREELVEVIYAAMDGYVYFAELESGAATRDRYNIGFPFKGSGSVDPRGYPLLYVGAGYSSAGGAARIFIISLVDGSVLHTFGNADSFAPRRWWAADSAPLVDAETDHLIYPSENGIIYFIKLNSVFDPEAGTMSIRPSEPVKWRFSGRRTSGSKYWAGFESSPAIWRGHLFIADNGGHLVCLDMNTLKAVWVQDILDDSNSSPVLELENGHPYIYISTSFHAGWRASASSSAPVPIWKIDAVTGEIVWQTDYTCYTASGLSGGVQGTIATGMYGLSDLIFVPVARTPTIGAGILAAIDKNTGEIVWEFQTRQYSWSSPVCVYDRDGNGYVIHNASGGAMYLLDGRTGALMDTIQLGGTVEASPAVYDRTIVIGTRASRIFGIKLT